MINIIHSKLCLGAVLLVAYGCSGNSGAHVSSTPRLNNNNQTATPRLEAASGMIVYIDPVTGEIITPPTGTRPAQLAKPTTEPSEKKMPELEPTLTPVPGGGIMIQLDSRFHNPLTATIDADGEVRFEHKPITSGVYDK